MFKFSLFIFLLIFNLCNSQIINPFNDDKCEMFKYSTTSKNAVVFDFLNDKNYEIYKNKKVEIDLAKTDENKKLLEEFKLKFPKVFTDSCSTFELFDNEKIKNVKSCNVNFKLLDQKFDFYIFEISGFEAHGFFLYNEKTKKSVFTSSYPQILENGKYIISVNNDINDTIIQFYNKNGNEYEENIIHFYAKFRVDEYFIYKDLFNDLNLILSLTSKSLKLIEEGKNGKKYEYDNNNGCNFKINMQF